MQEFMNDCKKQWTASIRNCSNALHHALIVLSCLRTHPFPNGAGRRTPRDRKRIDGGVPSNERGSQRHRQLWRAGPPALPDLFREPVRFRTCRVLVRRASLQDGRCRLGLFPENVIAGRPCSPVVRGHPKARIPVDVSAGDAHPVRRLRRLDLSDERFSLRATGTALALTPGIPGMRKWPGHVDGLHPGPAA